MNRKTLFPTPVYFKDLPNAKELNKYLFKDNKEVEVKQILKEKVKQTQDLVGIAKLI